MPSHVQFTDCVAHCDSFYGRLGMRYAVQSKVTSCSLLMVFVETVLCELRQRETILLLPYRCRTVGHAERTISTGSVRNFV